ncbi:Na+/H+ antiporter NhaC family protein [Butyricimonas faecalis]|uniref:Na+/H+ antiporter NhaC family protein n=1 Tax=Butyricimonas faecalis TaxID=2093856 RepID=A0A3Q9IMB2_9BACT|nr:Na+/H+ antiporter NhaC family protein [Butyricimonas faecalis]AZS28633.1 Na+/H+ antiporter NhaC family protein [Butyricimonas faecalis]
MQQETKPNFWALTPLIIFLSIYLVASVIMGDFYKMPITVAFLVASIVAVATSSGGRLHKRIDLFCKGAANSNIMLMVWIFILAGAFAQTAKAVGAVDATVNLALSVLPDTLLLAGMFIAACFISLSMGTSVGTIVALTPVAVGIATQTDLNTPFMVAIVVGGAMFGDNLSFISDTTIVATRTQGCNMKDKFKVNSLIVIPVAILITIIYLFQGSEITTTPTVTPIEWLKVIPYILVLTTALVGVNVMIVLLLGILCSGIVGIITGSIQFWEWIAAIGTGISGMGELIIITLLAGGMLEMIRYNGGIAYIIQKLTTHVKSKKGAELSIAALVSFADLCTANNTIALIMSGPIAKDIANRFGVDPRKSASLLDTFSCFVQGIIPYGAQLLMAAGLASITPLAIMQYLYYPYLMGVAALLAIFFRYPRKYSR